jgi:hypothetical protein
MCIGAAGTWMAYWVITDGISIPRSATTVEWKILADSDNFTIWPLGTAGL